jgi:pyruvate, orthophosphate dikinase
MQEKDFYDILKIMKGYPVTIRLLDPPLHEFVPHTLEDIKNLPQRVGLSFEDIKNRINRLHEFNPMFGHRGCRLAVTYPEIYEMQARAIAQAVAQLDCGGRSVVPEIMIPLIAMESKS